MTVLAVTAPAAATRRVAWPVQVARLLAVVAVALLATVTFPVVACLPVPTRRRAVRVTAGSLLAALGVRHHVRGTLPNRRGLLVADHVSWLDVLVLAAHGQPRLLTKREVRDWPFVGWIAARCGTLFIDRDRLRALPDTVAAVRDGLRGGDPVAVFPAGTTWSGQRGGRFHPALFQAAIDAPAPVVPITLRFLNGRTVTTAGTLIGDDTLLDSVRRVIAAKNLSVVLSVGAAIHPGPDATRGWLARIADAAVRR